MSRKGDRGDLATAGERFGADDPDLDCAGSIGVGCNPLVTMSSPLRISAGTVEKA